MREVIAALQELYGALPVAGMDPLEMILLENCAYLVDDATREATLARLREQVGLTPEELLAQTPERIAAVIAGGGMKPLMRAQKVLDAARIAVEIGLDELSAAIANDPKRAKALLRRFPSIGEPYADRVLLFAGTQTGVAPDSNALRVLCRLGFAREEKNYSAMYRAAVGAVSREVRDNATARKAHLLLRRHGQEVCKRTHPRCEICPLRGRCGWYGA